VQPLLSRGESEREVPRRSQASSSTDALPQGIAPSLGWRSVRLGLLLVAVGAVLMTAGFLTEVLLYRAVLSPEGPGQRMVSFRLINFGSGTLWGGGTLLLLGLGLCWRSPARMGTRGLAVAGFCCLGTAFLFYWAGDLAIAANEDFLSEHRHASRNVRFDPRGMRIIEKAEQRPPFSDAALTSLGYTALSLVIAGNLLLGLFLCQVARRLDRHGLAVTVVAYMVTALAFQILSVYVIVREPANADARNTAFASAITGRGPTWVYVVGAASVVWFLVEVVWTRVVVGRHLSAR
jgi:hypothetical protein